MEKVTEDIVTFLGSLSDHVVYVGKDQESKVYLLGSDWQRKNDLAQKPARGVQQSLLR